MINLETQHKNNTMAFRGLYDEITANLTTFANNEIQETDYKEWVFELIAGFEIRYQNWLKNENEYLTTLYSKGDKFFHLTGLAYLHILYDLPIVIAESLKKVKIDLHKRYYKIYTSLHETIAKSFNSNWVGKTWLMNFTETELRDLGVDHWLAGFRDKAWINAQFILDYKPEEANQKLDEYRDLILNQLKEAIKFINNGDLAQKQF